MAENWILSQEIDLQRGVQAPQVWPNALIVCGDNKAHTWRVTIMDNGRPAALTGTVTGYFIRGDDATVTVAGQLNGNVATVTLAQSCYNVEGNLLAVMRLKTSSGLLTLGALVLPVRRMLTDTLVDPENIVPSLDDLLEQIKLMEKGTAAANTAATRADTAASNADAKAAAANSAASAANTAAANANAKAAAADTATGRANTAASNADAKAAAANSAAALANEKAQAAHEAADRVNTSIAAATEATDIARARAAAAAAAAQEAYKQAEAASAGAQAAQEAAQHGEAVAKRLDVVQVAVEVLPPDADAYGAAEQTDSATLLRVGIPQLPVRNATLHMDDDARQVLQRTPTNAEIVTSWRVDPITTQLYKRIHGY